MHFGRIGKVCKMRCSPLISDRVLYIVLSKHRQTGPLGNWGNHNSSSSKGDGVWNNKNDITHEQVPARKKNKQGNKLLSEQMNAAGWRGGRIYGTGRERERE